jgi:NitT/TauT family transport system permease protein
VSAIAVERPRETRGVRAAHGAGRLAVLLLVLAALWGLWEGYRWLWIDRGWTWPFVVDETSMPHIHDVLQALWAPASTGGSGDKLLVLLLRAAAFTAKEAAIGFAIGAAVGFLLGVFLAQWRLLQRGFLPFVVASQTVPILAVAPIVVVYLGSRDVPAWLSVAVIAAYLTFFPVTINTLRGLHAADRRALELMRSYAAPQRWVLLKLRVPAAMPYIFSALRVSATACVVGAIVGEAPSSIQDGLGGKIIVFNQYYSLDPTQLWATNVVAAGLGIAFFLVVVGVERLVVRRAPENLV